ncbi:hypothetical protein B0H13DRAFT_2519208 [Mycena leptocephala]|nr:hypothetical protein B0H13DRAFT_2519208 [Mycena leptocephala]
MVAANLARGRICLGDTGVGPPTSTVCASPSSFASRSMLGVASPDPVLCDHGPPNTAHFRPLSSPPGVTPLPTTPFLAAARTHAHFNWSQDGCRFCWIGGRAAIVPRISPPRLQRCEYHRTGTVFLDFLLPALRAYDATRSTHTDDAPHTIASHGAHVQQQLLSLSVPSISQFLTIFPRTECPRWRRDNPGEEKHGEVGSTEEQERAARMPELIGTDLGLSDLSPGLYLFSFKTDCFAPLTTVLLRRLLTRPRTSKIAACPLPSSPNNSSSAVVAPWKNRQEAATHPSSSPAPSTASPFRSFTTPPPSSTPRPNPRPSSKPCARAPSSRVLRGPAFCPTEDAGVLRMLLVGRVEVPDVTLPNSDAGTVKDPAGAIQSLHGLRALTIRKGVGTYPCSMRLRTVAACPELHTATSLPPRCRPCPLHLRHRTRDVPHAPPHFVGARIRRHRSDHRARAYMSGGRPWLDRSVSYFDLDRMRRQGCSRGSLFLLDLDPTRALSLSFLLTPCLNVAPLPSSRAQIPHPPHRSPPRYCAPHACLRELIGVGTDVAVGGIGWNLLPRRYNHNHHRLSGLATPIPAYAITKYTGVLPSSRSTASARLIPSLSLNLNHLPLDILIPPISLLP